MHRLHSKCFAISLSSGLSQISFDFMSVNVYIYIYIYIIYIYVYHINTHIYICVYEHIHLIVQCFQSFSWCVCYVKNTNGSSGLVHAEKCINWPSAMKRVQHHHFQGLWSESVKPLEAICRYLCFFRVSVKEGSKIKRRPRVSS